MDNIFLNLKKIEPHLPVGGKARIYEITNVKKPLISQIFNGTQEGYVLDETRNAVLLAAIEVVKGELLSCEQKKIVLIEMGITLS